MWLLETLRPDVQVGMWVALITVSVLLLGVVVRISMAWSKVANDLQYLVRRFDEHLEGHDRDNTRRREEGERLLRALEVRIGRVEKAIDDLRRRVQRG